MTTTTRTKYRFKSRRLAEDAFAKTDHQRLYAEWFASALIKDTVTWCGQSNGQRIGWFRINHCAFVVGVSTYTSLSHLVNGIWDVQGSEWYRLIDGAHSHLDGTLTDLARRAGNEALASLREQYHGA